MATTASGPAGAWAAARVPPPPHVLSPPPPTTSQSPRLWQEEGAMQREGKGTGHGEPELCLPQTQTSLARDTPFLWNH